MLNKKTIFHPDEFGYLQAKIGEFSLQYRQRANTSAPWYIGIDFAHTVINSHWIAVFNEKDAKKALFKEYSRIKNVLKILRRNTPLNKEGYNIIPINPNSEMYKKYIKKSF